MKRFFIIFLIMVVIGIGFYLGDQESKSKSPISNQSTEAILSYFNPNWKDSLLYVSTLDNVTVGIKDYWIHPDGVVVMELYMNNAGKADGGKWEFGEKWGLHSDELNNAKKGLLRDNAGNPYTLYNSYFEGDKEWGLWLVYSFDFLTTSRKSDSYAVPETLSFDKIVPRDFVTGENGIGYLRKEEVWNHHNFTLPVQGHLSREYPAHFPPQDYLHIPNALKNIYFGECLLLGQQRKYQEVIDYIDKIQEPYKYELYDLKVINLRKLNRIEESKTAQKIYSDYTSKKN